jgi:hypothetical protein
LLLVQVARHLDLKVVEIGRSQRWLQQALLHASPIALAHQRQPLAGGLKSLCVRQLKVCGVRTKPELDAPLLEQLHEHRFCQSVALGLHVQAQTLDQ